jgi:hypothetical protein
MTLDQEDIYAIASAVVEMTRRLDSVHTDQHYLASLPIAEQKRLSRIEMARDREELKRRGK